MQSNRYLEYQGREKLVERQMLLNILRRKQSVETTGKEADRYRFITISREVGALGNYVAEELSTQLHWPVIDKEIVDFVAQNSHVRHDLVRLLDEKGRNLIHDTVHRLLGMTEGVSFGIEEYHQSLLKTLAYLAARGRTILLGRGAAIALQGKSGLHIRITAAREVRAQRLSRRWLVPMDEARSRVHQIDADRRAFVFQHYRQEYDDLRFYDIVFNTDHLAVGHVMASIMALMGLPMQVIQPDPHTG